METADLKMDQMVTLAAIATPVNLYKDGGRFTTKPFVIFFKQNVLHFKHK